MGIPTVPLKFAFAYGALGRMLALFLKKNTGNNGESWGLVPRIPENFRNIDPNGAKTDISRCAVANRPLHYALQQLTEQGLSFVSREIFFLFFIFFNVQYTARSRIEYNIHCRMQNKRNVQNHIFNARFGMYFLLSVFY